MKELLMLLIIGISLSMDAFSVSTVIGLTSINEKKIYVTSIIVGLFHFFMSLFGLFIGKEITKSINININLLLGIVLVLISLQMFIEYLKPTKKEISLDKMGLFLFAFGVSLDSFSVGIGITAITNNVILSSTIFTLCSSLFTFLGLSLGKYINNKFNKYSYLLGTIILLILGINFLCK